MPDDFIPSANGPTTYTTDSPVTQPACPRGCRARIEYRYQAGLKGVIVILPTANPRDFEHHAYKEGQSGRQEVPLCARMGWRERKDERREDGLADRIGTVQLLAFWVRGRQMPVADQSEY